MEMMIVTGNYGDGLADRFWSNRAMHDLVMVVRQGRGATFVPSIYLFGDNHQHGQSVKGPSVQSVSLSWVCSRKDIMQSSGPLCPIGALTTCLRIKIGPHFFSSNSLLEAQPSLFTMHIYEIDRDNLE
jgi:hypothetical protein